MAAAGLRVRVWEAQGALDHGPRTLIVTPAWTRLIGFDAEPAILNRITTFELISRGESTRVPLHEPDLVVERAVFLKLLAGQVEGAGGELNFNRRLRSLDRTSSGYRLSFGNGHSEHLCESARVLGADGLESAVARAVAAEPLRSASIIQARVGLPRDLSADTARVWFDRESTRFFYWLIPESSDQGVAGLIHDTRPGAEVALDTFLRDRGLTPRSFQAADVPIESRGGRGPSGDSDGLVLLAGDAAGQVKVTTVGGVVTGMRGAVTAARTLVRGDGRQHELRPLRLELGAHAALRHVLDRFTDEDYDDLLRSLNRQGLRLLRRYTRDEVTRVAWRLVLAQPRWLHLAARALARSLSGRAAGSNPGEATR